MDELTKRAVDVAKANEVTGADVQALIKALDNGQAPDKQAMRRALMTLRSLLGGRGAV